MQKQNGRSAKTGNRLDIFRDSCYFYTVKRKQTQHREKNMSFFKETADRYESELLNSVVPFWEQHSIDSEYGGFLTCLERDGTVYDTNKYMWMQWREVYLFAVLYNSVFSQKRYLDYAVDGFNFLTHSGKKPDGNYHFSLDQAGNPVSTEVPDGAEIFSESFAAIACAELYRATGKNCYRDEALRCWKIYWSNVSKSEQKPAFPDGTPYKRFGHYMIALNVLQIMKTALQTDEFNKELEFAARMVFEFCNPEFGIIQEKIKADGSFDLSSPEGRLVNPGHALESMWFMMEYIRGSGRKPLLDRTLKLTVNTLRCGWDKELGGIVSFRDILGKPVLKDKYMQKTWWPQNEAATAALSAYEMSENEEFLEFFRKIDAFAWKYLRDTEYPEWFSCAEIDGKRAHTYKGSRWKGLFHLPRYLMKCAEICRRLEQGS